MNQRCGVPSSRTHLNGCWDIQSLPTPKSWTLIVHKKWLLKNQKMGQISLSDNSNLNTEECIYLKDKREMVCNPAWNLLSLDHPSAACITVKSRMNQAGKRRDWPRPLRESVRQIPEQQAKASGSCGFSLWAATSPKRPFDAGRGKWTGDRMKSIQWYPFLPMTSLRWDLLMSPHPHSEKMLLSSKA